MVEVPMFSRFVAQVPERVWKEGCPSHMRVWENEFNVAGWLRFLGGAGAAKLVIVHVDETGEHVTDVDHVHIKGEGTSLMSGMVRVRFTGRVDQVRVDLQVENSGQRFLVDELFIQRRGSNLRREDKLISSV